MDRNNLFSTIHSIRNGTNLIKMEYFVMKRYKSITICLILLFSLLSCKWSDHTDKNLSIKMVRISERALLFSCLETNVLAISSSRGLIVIDTHRSPWIMREIRNTIEKEFGSKNFKYVINTHGHQDHASGNQVFPDATIIGHDFCPVFMRQFPANSLRNIWYQKKSIEDAKDRLKTLDTNSAATKELVAKITARQMTLADLERDYLVTPPATTFSERMDLPCGDLNVVLLYCGSAHTDNDIFITIPEEGLLATGDIFVSAAGFGFQVNKMVDTPRLLSCIDLVLQDSIQTVVPGHGSVFDRSVLASLRELLREKSAQLDQRESAARLLDSLIETKGLQSALREYGKLIHSPRHYFSEQEFDVLGYRLLGRDLMLEAITVFKINAENNPGSANAYDSLAEAFSMAGEIKSAITNYQQSLILNSANKNAEEMIKILTSSSQRGQK